jgi:hypothetical protein
VTCAAGMRSSGSRRRLELRGERCAEVCFCEITNFLAVNLREQSVPTFDQSECQAPQEAS